DKIIILTIGLVGVINFIGTPYVFNGFFMKSFWNYVVQGLLLLFLLEINLLNIKQYKIQNRILIHIFSVSLIFIYFSRNNRLDYIIMFVYVILALSIYIIDYLKNYYPSNDTYHLDRSGYLSVFGFLFLALYLLEIDLLDESILIYIALVVGIVSSIGAIIVFNIMNLVWKSILTYTLLVMMISVSVIFVMGAGLNYALDTSEPEVHYVEISDLNVNTGPRSITSYEVYFTLNGNTHHIGVTKSEYYELEIEDPFRVSIYSGFFGLEYIIAE
ncbi:MAG: hypothetical protein ACOCZ5_02575, partial [bacterium]